MTRKFFRKTGSVGEPSHTHGNVGRNMEGTYSTLHTCHKEGKISIFQRVRERLYSRVCQENIQSYTIIKSS